MTRKSKWKQLKRTIFIFWEWQSEKYYIQTLKLLVPKYKNFKYINEIWWFKDTSNLVKTFDNIVKNLNKLIGYNSK